jgi:hypothetical protein
MLLRNSVPRRSRTRYCTRAVNEFGDWPSVTIYFHPGPARSRTLTEARETPGQRVQLGGSGAQPLD